MKTMNLIKKILFYLNLEHDLDDFERIHETIKKDLEFRGTNLWILMFAIIIASLGLNMNSPAVIIGAMLISPLMGPINGMGYSIATYNFPLLRQSIKNFTFAVIASLISSTAYFSLSPISTAHSELLARTNPTIYDVLIAFFGGLAGIVAISSRQKGNVIPGVAIATALMPPLCTAGYGLATFQIDFFFGAIYLFTINTVFIAFSSVVVSQILKFPITTIVAESQKRKINRWISFVIILVSFPSIYFGYNLTQREKFIENANTYIKNVSIFEGNYLLKSNVNAHDRNINLIYGGIKMDENQMERIKEKVMNYSLNNTRVNIQQGLAIDSFDSKNTEMENLRVELSRLNFLIQERDRKIDSISTSKLIGRNILDEISNLYPQIIKCSYGEAFTFMDTIPDHKRTEVVIFSLNKNKLNNVDKGKINKWLQTKLNSDQVQVFYEK